MIPMLSPRPYRNRAWSSNVRPGSSGRFAEHSEHRLQLRHRPLVTERRDRPPLAAPSASR